VLPVITSDPYGYGLKQAEPARKEEVSL
jgi:hypothetical protein